MQPLIQMTLYVIHLSFSQTAQPALIWSSSPPQFLFYNKQNMSYCITPTQMSTSGLL